jgi:sortase A
VVGRLAIPRLGLSAIVRDGDSDATLRVALGHIPSTAFPGQTGNVGIAGHRDTLFRQLRRVRKHDVIWLETPSGKFAYEVQSLQIVKPADVGVLQPGRAPELTLVTCYPFGYIGAAPDRFIVHASQISGAS